MVVQVAIAVGCFIVAGISFWRSKELVASGEHDFQAGGLYGGAFAFLILGAVALGTAFTG